jgi:hypothetical protein
MVVRPVTATSAGRCIAGMTTARRADCGLDDALAIGIVGTVGAVGDQPLESRHF